MSTRPFSFAAADGSPRAGKLELPDGPPVAAAIFAHCFTCSKDTLAAVRISRALAHAGLAVLRCDFAGLGGEGGELRAHGFSGDLADLRAAADAMAEAGYDVQLLIGHSLGGAAVLAAAADISSVRAVATLAAPFRPDHVEGAFGEELKAVLEHGAGAVTLSGRPFTLSRDFVHDLRAQDPAAQIGRLKKALLVMHAPGDTTVGIENAEAIFKAARHPKSFVSLDHADHLLTKETDARYAAAVIAAWVRPYLRPALEAGAAATQGEADDGGVWLEETGQGRFQLAVRAGPARFLADEPVSVGGMATGPTPYALLAAALGACTAMTLRLYAEQKGWTVDRIGVRATHAREASDPLPDVFTREIRLDGALDEAQRARLLEIADRCPVHRTLTGGARVVTRFAGADRPPLPAPEAAAQHVRDAAGMVAAQG